MATRQTGVAQWQDADHARKQSLLARRKVPHLTGQTKSFLETFEHTSTVSWRQRRKRMTWIGQFLDEDSDAARSEGGARDEDALLREPNRMSSPPPQQGRGKMDPLLRREDTGLRRISYQVTLQMPTQLCSLINPSVRSLHGEGYM